MRILIEFIFDDFLSLPIQYNEILQGFIYKNVDPYLARWLHDHGVEHKKRKFKFFTFSRLEGKYRIYKDKIEFFSPVRFKIASIHSEMLKSIVENLLKANCLTLYNHKCEISKIEIISPICYRDRIKVRAISPITIYSTFRTPEGKKKTYYYSPFEKDWKEQIIMNLIRKAKALGYSGNFESSNIKPLKVGKRDLKIIKYKGTIIKGWMGLYELSLPRILFDIAFDSGLGSKNSQGFGMIEVVSDA